MTVLDQHEFSEISALLDVFSEAKNRRGARYPTHVMVVEDDPLTQRIVRNAFRQDYAMISANDAHQAVAEYITYAPDIVFLDIGLPDATGFIVMDQILCIDPDAFIVMFSSNNYPQTVEKALHGGAKGFVPKPFKKEMLHHFIHDSAAHHSKYHL